MQLQFSLIGCGRIAHRLAENIITTGILNELYDVFQEKANETSATFFL